MPETFFPEKFADSAQTDLVRTSPAQIDPAEMGPACGTRTRAYGALGSDGPINAMTIERRALMADDVAIDILFCGVCDIRPRRE